MKCDQCGFEHNSRSVCPKCGAPVIYVNEDYERRKKEWEAAQKNGKADVLPPGIRYSTKEEHDMKQGRDRMTEQYKEGVSEMTSLSLTAWKEKFLTVLAKFLIFCRKQFQKMKKKKRGVENKIVRELTFDDAPDTLETSKLVLEHKIFKDRRKPVLIGIPAGLAAIAAVVVVLNIILHIDRSQVMVFDGNNWYAASSPEKTLFQTEGGGAEILTASSDGKIVLFETEQKICLYQDGDTQTLATAENAVVAGEAFISENGLYYAFVMCIEEPDPSQTATDTEATYILYVGNVQDGLTEAVNNSYVKTILDLSSDGTATYVNQKTEAYGLILNATVAQYDFQTKKETAIIDAFTEYRYVKTQEMIYFFRDGQLYQIDLKKDTKPVFLDEDVIALAEDITQTASGAFYAKATGYYYMDAEMTEPELVARTTDASLKFCFDAEGGWTYATDGTVLYRITAAGAKPEKVFALLDGTVLYNGNDHFLIAVSDEGILYKLDGFATQLAEGVSGLLPIINAEGFSYVQEGVRYIRKSPEKKAKALSALLPETEGSALIYSGNFYYFYDYGRILWKISKNGKTCTSLGPVENCIFID